MEKYYFKVTGINGDNCTEPCKLLDNGVMIGSVKCQACGHCKEVDATRRDMVFWIKCEKIEEATK